ncbi:MAG: alpha/beta fold hydrolase [Planctomycetota bacterium]
MRTPRSKRLAIDTAGTGDALVFVHGLGATASVWEPQIHAFRDRYFTLRYDLDGSGRSALSGQLSIESWVADLDDILRANNIGKARFVGHSLGTLILQHFAVQYPDKVTSLALLGVNRAPNDQRRQAMRERAEKVLSSGPEAIADAVAKGTLSPHTFAKRPELAGFVREMLVRQSRDGYAASCIAASAAKAAAIASIRCPVLVLSGKEDSVSPPVAGEVFASELSRGKFLALDQCGHWHPIEQPSAVNAALGEFFKTPL